MELEHLELARLASCRHCHQWQVAEDDAFCGACGRSLARVSLTPASVELVAGDPKIQHRYLVLESSAAKTIEIEIKPQAGSAAHPALSFEPSILRLAPSGKESVKVKLDRRWTSPRVSEEVQLACVLDRDSLRALPFSVMIRQGPVAHLDQAELQFGQLQEGTRAELSLRLENRGGAPLRLTGVTAEGSRQLGIGSELLLPLEVPPGERREIPVFWDTRLADELPRKNAAGFRCQFEAPATELFVPAKARVFLRRVRADRQQVTIDPALSGHDYLETLRLENLGTVDCEILSIESDAQWLTILGARRFLLGCAGGERTAGAKSPPSADLPSFDRVYACSLLCRPLELAEGRHQAELRIAIEGESEPLRVELELRVLRPERSLDWLGIDFGTTNSVIAVPDRGEASGLALLGEQADGEASPLVPSILVFLGSLDAYAIGRRARNEIETAAENAVRSIKRLLGTRRRHVFYGQELAPEEIAARIIRKLKHLAERRIFERSGRYAEIRHAIVTVPANFYDAQIRAVLAACRAAGLDTAAADGQGEDYGIILDEPSAAALFFANRLMGLDPALERKMRRQRGLNLLVFDHGGGTLDVSVANLRRIEGGQLELTTLATAGSGEVGGDSFDLALVRPIAARCRAKLPAFDPASILDSRAELDRRRQREGWPASTLARILAARDRWKSAAEEAKIGLGDRPSTLFRIEAHGLPCWKGGQLGFAEREFEMPIGREDLEAWIGPLLAKIELPVVRALGEAALRAEQIDYLLHTGRQSQMRAVRERVRSLFPGLDAGRDLLDPAQVKICVAQGAALYGSIRHRAGGRIRFSQQGRRLPHSYGVDETVGIAETRFRAVIQRGSRYPIETELEFLPHDIPDGRWLHLRIFQQQGDDPRIDGNKEMRLLGELRLDTLEDGEPGCVVRFSVDANRILKVAADGKEINLDPRSAVEEEEEWTW